MTGLAAIYALCEPDTGDFRYVGKTVEPKRRLQQHRREALLNPATTHKNRWLSQLRRAGLSPSMWIITWVPVSEWKQHERKWIKLLRESGCRLTNGTDGGDGVAPGHVWSVATIEKRAAALRGRKRPAEFCERLSVLARQRIEERGPDAPPPPVFIGEANPKAKVTEKAVAELRRSAHTRGAMSAWAREHGVSYTSASAAATGRTWKHVAEPPCKRGRRQRLSDDDVAEIRRLRASGASPVTIAPRFGVTPSRISQLTNQTRRAGANQRGSSQ